MNSPYASWTSIVTLALSAFVVAGCGGGAAVDLPPVPVIVSPAEGATFRAGDTLAFIGAAADNEDGNLPASALTWWVELHHDAHTHPLRPAATGAAGAVTIPVRGETSDNVWYRFHLRATDSSGHQLTVTRDVMPQKVQLTLATQPAGLQLALDVQPATAPLTFTGVVGMERDLTAVNQTFNGRLYQFSAWSDGGAATHTVSTPAANTSYTATFIDAGPTINQPPTVSLSAAASGTVGTAMVLTASAADAADADGSVARVEFFDGGTLVNTDTTSPYVLAWTPASAAIHNLTARTTDDAGATTISATVAVIIGAASGGDTTAPTATLTAPADFASSLTGTLILSASAADNVTVAGVEFQVDGMTIGSEDIAAPYQASLNTGAHAAGQHRLDFSDSLG